MVSVEPVVCSCSREIEAPPAKAWWCVRTLLSAAVVEKLKYHRLKPGGVWGVFAGTQEIEAPDRRHALPS